MPNGVGVLWRKGRPFGIKISTKNVGKKEGVNPMKWDGYGVGLWKAIRKYWNILSSRVAFLLGNGRRVKFWKDKWCGDKQLSIFPLFICFYLKEAWVEDVWKERNNKALDNKEHSIQGIKLSFLCNLWAWSKLFIVLSPSSNVDLLIGWDLVKGCFLLSLFVFCWHF